MLPIQKRQTPTAENRSKECFQLIHSDLSGKFSVPSPGKSLYHMTFIDDKSRFAFSKTSQMQPKLSRILRARLKGSTTPKFFDFAPITVRIFFGGISELAEKGIYPSSRWCLISVLGVDR
jgi:hypothetical protein